MKRSPLIVIMFLVICLFTLKPAAPQAPAGANLPGPASTWSLAAAGDAIITRRVAQFNHAGDPGFRRLVEVIAGADAAFLNLELSLFRLNEFKGWPEVENGGNWELGPPEVALDLKSMGFDLFNRANNHTTDYGVEGMRMTDKLLDELGIVHAGSGENLGYASRPGYFEMPKGRVALIGFAASFTPMSRAGESRPDMVGRPGLNALRIDTTYQADPLTFETLRSVAAKFRGRVPDDPQAPVRIFGTTVGRGSESRVVEAYNQNDAERIVREVRNAAKQADFAVVSCHSHQSGRNSTVPPSWMIEFAKRCIDAGAVAFIVHGPHQLRGIEVYRDRPIFYSLGNFIFQNETIDPMPSDHYEIYDLPPTALATDLYDARFNGGTTGFPSSPVWYESVVAVPTYKGTQMAELKLYPIDMAQKAPRSQRGTPRLADEATGRKIIERLAQQSAAFGTTIVYDQGLGIWRPGAGSAPAKEK